MLSADVTAFLDKAADVYARQKRDEFREFLFSSCTEIQSPIEQLFLIAMDLVSEFNYTPMSTTEGKFKDTNDDLLVIPQWQAGKYRVDFALRRHPIDRIVCVELDGHEFHDRDERQRRYEKARDRFLTAEGYSVLHFTGAEVFKDPCASALEAFKLAANYPSAIHPFANE